MVGDRDLDAKNTRMINEAWTKALDADQEEQDAEDALNNGKTKEDFIKEEEEKNKPNDKRSLAEKIAAATKAWAEAMKNANDGFNADIEAAKKAKAEKEKM